jgi:hypothetical protein
MVFAKIICYVKHFFRKFMSGAEFERTDGSNGDELIPRVSRETRFKLLMEFLPAVKGNVDHRAATYLERIRGVNPIVVEYIAGLAGKTPEGLNLTHVSTCVVLAGVLVYRLLELEFEQRGKEMPIVRMESVDSLIVDMEQEEGYFHKLANSLVTENFELLEALSTFWLNVHTSNEREQFLVGASGLGVYALIKAQAKADSKHRRTD